MKKRKIIISRLFLVIAVTAMVVTSITIATIKSVNFVATKLSSYLMQNVETGIALNEEVVQKNFEHNSIVVKDATQLIGTFDCTAYCACEECSEEWGDSNCLGGTCTPYYTVAADPNIIPLGTHIFVNGREYVVEDVGGAIEGYKLDFFVPSHSETFDSEWNMKNVPVFKVEG